MMDDLLRAVLTASDADLGDRLAAATRGLVLEPPPPAVRAAMAAAVEAWASTRRRPGPVQRLWGTLAFDSAATPLLAGARNATLNPARHLVYETAAADVAFHMAADPWAPGAVTLDGQLLALGEAAELAGPCQVFLVIEGVGVAVTTTDDLGQFRFEALDRGPYELVFVAGGTELHVGPVPVDDRA